MNELRRFILESHFGSDFARALYDALPMFEAVNINKDFLIKEAGSPERFKEVRDGVQAMWNSENMNAQMSQKAAQKVLNLLYLMEIRSPGFTDRDKLHSIHDLFIHNMLDTKFLNVVNSDTTPEQATEILDSAVKHQVQQQKAYPDLSEEEEKIWNRVKVYHEFPDGFKWVCAVDDNGKIVSHIPSTVTSKTMNHCGNTPRAGSDDQYWELRDADGKAYLTIILNKDGNLEESKSWGNQVNKYRRQIQPYVKWFLMDKVNGVGPRYDYGYSTHTNYGVKDFIGDDPEFIDYVTEFKPSLLGNTEEKILFWKGALEGVVTVSQMKRLFMEKLSVDDLLKADKFKAYKKASKFKYDKEGSYYSSSVFGSNRFEVLCAACGACPFSETELKKCISDGDIELEEFVNYDIHLLTPEMQREFVAYDEDNFDKIMELSEEVAAFKVTDDLIYGLIDPLRNGTSDDYYKLFNMFKNANPPEKVHAYAKECIEDDAIIRNISGGKKSYETYWDRSFFLADIFIIMARFSDIQVCNEVKTLVAATIEEIQLADHKGNKVSAANRVIGGMLSIGKERGEQLVSMFEPRMLTNLIVPPKNVSLDDVLKFGELGGRLVKEYGDDYIWGDLNTESALDNRYSKTIYLLNMAKIGKTVPGLNNLDAQIVAGVKKLARSSNSVSSDTYRMYMLGLDAMPECYDMLGEGVLTEFICRYVDSRMWHTGDDISKGQATRCVAELRAMYENPSKAVIKKLAQLKLFDMLREIVDMVPADTFEKILRDSLYLRAAMTNINSKGCDYTHWKDTHALSGLVKSTGFTVPYEEWPDWIQVMGEQAFVKLLICTQKSDAIYNNKHFSDSIIRVFSGHSILCDESELSAPVPKNAGMSIEDMFGYCGYQNKQRIARIIATRISPLIEDGTLVIDAQKLRDLSASGMINPRAYRIAFEKNMTGANSSMEISSDQVWKMIRSPALPQLVCNTVKKYFKLYKKHTFEYPYNECRCVTVIRNMSAVLERKSAYYQVMRSVQALYDSGIVQEIKNMAQWITQTYDAAASFNAFHRKCMRKYGFEYTYYYAKPLLYAAEAIEQLYIHYQAEPVPEPSAKTRKPRKTNGTTA